jgi:hypothetical protein
VISPGARLRKRTVSPARTAAVAVAGLRLAYAAALAVSPARTTRPWIGTDGERLATKVPIRGLAAREAAVHAGVAIAALGGAPVRPWLVAGIAGDVSDIAATFASRSAVPDGAAGKTALAAGGSAALSAAVAAYVDC